MAKFITPGASLGAATSIDFCSGISSTAILSINSNGVIIIIKSPVTSFGISSIKCEPIVIIFLCAPLVRYEISSS
ncbi:hypothetical protein D3C84_1037760 [compost metagenome]